MKKNNHEWSVSDDIVAFYIYRCNLLSEIEPLAKKLDVKVTSLKMRIKNFSFLDTNNGLRNYSKQSETVYNDWKNSSLNELKSEYENIISKINN